MNFSLCQNKLLSVPDSHPGAEVIRCECHRLIARVVNSELELLCPRCKRKLIIDFRGIAESGDILKRVRCV